MPDKPTLSVRIVVKHVASSAIALAVSSLTAKTVDNYTSFEKDAYIVKLAAGTVGMIVAAKLQPHTDKAVDVSADFIVAKRQAQKAKKDTKKEEEK